MALGSEDRARKRPREASQLPTRRKIKMEPPEDKENQPPPRNAQIETLESLMKQLPQPNARYADARGFPTQLLRFGESARALFLLEKPSERRARLVVALKDSPRDVNTWLELLRCPLAGNSSKYGQTRLVRRALTCVDSPEARASEGYTEMFIMLAKLSDTEEGVRQKFQEMKKRGAGSKQPLFYEEEAAFEYTAGNKELAEEILERGVDDDVFTPNQKEELMRRVESGKAGWVAAFSGGPKFQSLRSKVLSTRKTLDTNSNWGLEKVVSPQGLGGLAKAPVHNSTVLADTTPISSGNGREARTPAPLHKSMNPSNDTPVSSGRSGIGFSTVSKVPRHGDKSPLLTTPSLPTRSSLKSQTTSRKTHNAPARFLLGGPPLRVIASNGDDDDDDDDENAMMGSQMTPSKTSKVLTPIKKKITTFKQSSPAISSERKAKLKVDVGNISHILEWKPKGKSSPTCSKDAKPYDYLPVKKPIAADKALLLLKPKMPPSKEIEALPPSSLSAGDNPKKNSVATTFPESAKAIKPPTPQHIRSPRVQEPLENRADGRLRTSVLAKSNVSYALDYYRSPKKRQRVNPSEPVETNCVEMVSPSSVSSASSPPVSAMTNDLSRDALESLTSRVVVCGKRYIKLEQIGSGGSSKVYRMLGPDLKIYALKKIKLKKLDAQSIEQYTNEINLLRQLKGNPHIIQLVDAEQDLKQRQINVVMEHGEIDLNERLHNLKGGMDENLLRVLWTQMLQAVDAIHSARIIHGDLKPANFLFVNGALKLIDFGIAKEISNDTTNIERDSQIGTINFMSPEAIQGNTQPDGQRHPMGKMKVGRASDIWSLGCILYQIVYSKPPFADVHSIIEKFRCIIDPAVPIPFPALANTDLEDVIRSCLQRDHRLRPPITGDGGLLEHPFLRSGISSPVNPSPTASVTMDNAAEVLSQLGDLLRSRGVATSRLNMFMSIGQEGLRDTRDGISRTHRYVYNTQERRTDI